MKKTFTISVLLTGIILLLSLSICAVFNDVSSDDYGYSAITKLVSKGVLVGYTDGNFRPDGLITRAEAAAVITRADGSASEITDGVKSVYNDVTENHWGIGYIMKATENGILAGMGNGKYSPEENVTYNQIIKMIVCMNSYGNRSESIGGWPFGYVMSAYERGYIDTNFCISLLNGNIGNTAISRREAAILVDRAMADNRTGTSNARAVAKEAVINIGGKVRYIGMPAEILGEPDEKISSGFGWNWQFYDTGNYANFVALGIKNNKVVAFQSAGSGFEYLGKVSGDPVPAIKSGSYITLAVGDKNDGNRLHAVFVYDPNASATDSSASALAGESRLNFHLTNAFCVYHGRAKYIWDDRAAKAAELHSKDLANNNYFSHTSLNGTTFSERLTAQGIKWQSCAENIYAGSISGFDAYYQLINSPGHRDNILGNCKKIGVGAAYNSRSTYKGYFTQNFITEF